MRAAVSEKNVNCKERRLWQLMPFVLRFLSFRLLTHTQCASDSQSLSLPLSLPPSLMNTHTCHTLLDLHNNERIASECNVCILAF